MYGDKSLTNYFNLAAFAYPAAGTYGDHVRNSIEGPGFWSVDLALSRLIRLPSEQTLEMRMESFNLLNHMNWANPTTNYDSRNFGRITAINGSMRIIQFGVKYGF